MTTMAPTQPDLRTSTGNGGRLVAADGRELPLRGVHLAAEAGGGIARVVLTQRFANPYDVPLEVRYLLPLPADGAVSGFAFTLGDERIVGEVTGRQAARERFERALVEGRTAALLEQERASLFTQRVGNVPPGAEVVAEVTVDQPLRWLEEGAWEWRFPTVVGPRYMGAPGRVADAAALEVPVAAGPLGLRATLALAIQDRLTGPLESPSHPVQTRGERPLRVSLEGEGGARLDRDVVVRWPVALPDVSAQVLAARPDTAAHDGDTFALLTVAPPTGGWQAVPRDLTFLIDTSGSMGGRPLEQAACVVAAMLATLGVRDRIELIEFGSAPRRWQKQPVLATEAHKQAAIEWVRGLRASGSTEMHRAVLEAMRPLRPDSQRQVVLVTDGFIGFEAEIVRTLLQDLPAGARLHTVGVGSSVNRTLTRAAARAGRGTELIVGLEEDAERVAARLVARTTAPLVTDLQLAGAGLLEVAPRQLPDLYAEAPALLAVRLSAPGGELVLRGRTAEGAFERRLTVPALERGQGSAAIAALFAREKVEDLETALGAGGNPGELHRAIEDTGVAFQIATRLTSWVAVSRRVTVDPRAARVAVEQPHELPLGVSAEGLGLRAANRPAAPGQAVPRKLASLGFRAAPEKKVEYLSQEDAKQRLGVDDEELRRLVQDAELRGFRAGEEMKFKAEDVANLVEGRESEPTIHLTDADQEMGIAESSDELILDDSTSDAVVRIGDLPGGAGGGLRGAMLGSPVEDSLRAERRPSPAPGPLTRSGYVSADYGPPANPPRFAAPGATKASRVPPEPRGRRWRPLLPALVLLLVLLALAVWGLVGLFGDVPAPGGAPGERGQPGGVGPR